MSELIGIAYKSQALADITSERIDAILADSRQYNREHDITGVLFYAPGMFFQYFEGAPDAMQATYQRIQAASAHSNIEQLHQTTIKQRQFDGWHMAFARPRQSFLQEFAHDVWVYKLAQTSPKPGAPGVLDLVKTFWHRCQRT